MIPLKIWAVSAFFLFVSFCLHRAAKEDKDYDANGSFEQIVSWTMLISFLVAVFSCAATIWTSIP